MASYIDAEIQAGYDNIRIVSNLLGEGLTSKEIDLDKLREAMENSLFDFIEFADPEGWDHTVMGVYQAANKITRLLTADYFGERALAYLATPEGRIIASSQGYDPSAENYMESLPEGGHHEVLENCQCV